MDNFIKHLCDRIPAEKEFAKYDDKNTIKIIIKKKQATEVSSYLKTISEIYKISGEIVEYLSKVSEVTVNILPGEIIIFY